MRRFCGNNESLSFDWKIEGMTDMVYVVFIVDENDDLPSVKRDECVGD